MKKVALPMVMTALVVAIAFALVGCGSNEDYNAKNHVTFKAAYAIDEGDGATAELWVFSTVDADDKENMNGVRYSNAGKIGSPSTTGPEIYFDDNSYGDNYYLNKRSYDALLEGTGYGCWSDMDTLYAGSGDTYGMAMSFTIAKADIENSETARVSNMGYDFKFDTADIQTVGSRAEMATLAAELK